MFKKIAIYGLAFGSLSAAMLLIQYYNGLYREANFISAMPVLVNLILPGLATWLFVKALRRMSSAEKPINMGRALFGSLLVCTLVAVCTIGAYQHVYYNEPTIMNDMRTRSHAKMEAHFNSDATVPAADKPKKIQEAKDNYEQNLSLGNFARIQFMMCLSTGMIVALITFLFNLKQQKK